jgi:AAA15 family ATPase/GTPase
MITKLSINGFKGFEHLEIPTLSRINLLGGRNNIGKTSILEALFMFLDRLNPNIILRQFAWRGVAIIPFEPESMWAPIFFNYDLQKEISILVTINNNEEKMSIKFNPRYIPASIPAIGVRPGTATQIRTDQKPMPSQSLDIVYDSKTMKNQQTHVLMRADGTQVIVDNASYEPRQATFMVARAPMNSAEDAQKFGKLDIQGKQEKVVDVLKIIEPKLKSLSSIAMGESSLIHGDIGLSRKIPISYMGDGVSKLLSIILSIATLQNGVLLIDEFENGIHYSVMPKIWEAVAKAAFEYDCQVIGTTHSYECLKAAYTGIPESLRNDFSYIRFDKIDNRTMAKRFDFETLKVALDANMEVR